jgi:hypothetical protein
MKQLSSICLVKHAATALFLSCLGSSQRLTVFLIEPKSKKPLYLGLLLFFKNAIFIFFHLRKEGTALSALEATAETHYK